MASRGARVAAFVLCGVASSSWAQSSVNLLQNPTFTGGQNGANPPAGHWHQWRLDAPCSGEAPFPGTYAYGNDVDGVRYIEIDITNNSSCSGNYVLVMPVAGSEANLIMGADYTFTGKLKVLQHDGTSSGSLGFHLMDGGGIYVGEAPGAYANGTQAEQTPTLLYSAGEPLINNAVPASFLPRLSSYSIKPGGHLRLRLKSPFLSRGDAPTAVTIGGLVNPVLMSGPDKLLKLSVPVKTLAYSGPAISSTVSFLDANGVSRGTMSHTVNFLGVSTWGSTHDAYQESLPPLPPGRYTIRYSLTLPANKVQAGAGATESVTSQGNKRYDIGTLVVSEKAGMYVGQHFHRYPGPNTEGSNATPLPSNFAYRFARSLNHDGTSDAESGLTLLKWWTGDNVYDWTVFDKWAAFHAGKDATAKKRLLITFMGSPGFLSSNPTYSNYYSHQGLLAAPKNLDVYKRMVSATVNRYKDRIFAVECWNEPDAGYFGGDPLSNKTVETQLADVCKVIHTATKAVDPTIATICPQTAVPENMQAWLTARTSQNEPITNYCDMVGAHTYGRIGIGANGQRYFNQPQGLIQAVKTMRAAMQSLGIKKPLAITEAGFYDSSTDRWTDGKVFSQKSPQDRATISYQTLATARELGVMLFGLYSFDGGADVDASLGFEGNAFGTQAAAENQVVNTANSNAARDLGASTGTSPAIVAAAAAGGIQPFALDLFMVPSVTSVSWAANNPALSFKLAVANTTLLAGKSLAVSIVPSASRYEYANGNNGPAGSSVYTIDSLTGPTGSTCIAAQPTVGGHTVTQWTCEGMNVPAGEVVTLVANGRMTPSSAQIGWMNGWLNYSYYFTVTSTASWADRPTTVAIPTVTSAKIVLSR